MIPESKYIKSEITIRDMAIDSSVKLSRESLVRWLALSLGLIGENETRTNILPLLDVMIDAHLAGNGLELPEIFNKVNKKAEMDDKTVYYHLGRLKKAGFISKKENKYYFGDGFERDLNRIIENAYRSRIDNSFLSVREAINSLQSRK
jgi:DNA-binding transcriptional ArsR family regulator